MLDLIPHIIRAMRPHQWVKNLFVFAPLIFAKKLFLADGRPNLPLLALTCLAFGLFCLLSGMVYILNDLADRDRDREHPLKKNRPIASGKLPVSTAKGTLVIGTTLAFVLGAWLLSPMVLAAMACYFILNVGYSFRLKRVVYIDIACIAVGFLLRILGGALAVNVHVTGWLYACTFLIACFLALGKRTHEMLNSGDNASLRRGVLRSYTRESLYRGMWLTGAATAACYISYTFSDWAYAQFGTHSLPWSIPFILFGLRRFVQIVQRIDSAESPTEAMIRDVPFLVNLALWGAVVINTIYL